MSFQLNFLNSVGGIYSLLVMIFHVYCLWGTSLLSQTLFYLSQLALVFILSVLPLSQHRLLSWPSFSLEISTPYCTCRKIILPTHYFHHITTCFMNLEGLPLASSLSFTAQPQAHCSSHCPRTHWLIFFLNHLPLHHHAPNPTILEDSSLLSFWSFQSLPRPSLKHSLVMNL